MWNNNGFPGQGNFQQVQDNFSQSYGEDGFIPFSPINPGQQQFPIQGQFFGIDYNSPASASQFSTPGEYSPEINAYEDRAFTHNQYPNSDGLEQHIPQRPFTASIGSSRPALTARAEELKAQLLKGKERARSGTPPVIAANSVAKPLRPAEEPVSFRGSPGTPLSGSDGPAASRRTSGVMDEDLNDLISEAKAAANVKSDNKINGSSVTKSKEPITVDLRIKSRAPTIETSTRGTNGEKDVRIGQGKPVVKTLTRKETNGELSDISEGEIREVAMKDLSPPHNQTRETRITVKQNHRILESPNPKSRPDEDGKAKQSYGNQERRQTDSKSVPQVKATRAFTERHEEVDRMERKGNHSEIKNDHKRGPDVDHRLYEAKVKSKYEDTAYQRLEAPTLARLLLANEDLKDWLDVTGYHNEEYRQKILNRRRALAALDAQKAKLLEEIENEERGGMSTKISSVGMLPPPMPNKISAAVPAAAKKEVSAPKSSEPSAPTKVEQETRPKRSYAEYHGSNDQDGAGKVARTEERTPHKGQNNGIKVKTDSPIEARRPQSRGYGLSRRKSVSPRRRSPSPRRRSPSRRRSLSADNRALRRDERDYSRKSRSPDRGRKSSFQIKRSPSNESHENKRSKFYEHSPPPSDQDHNDYKGRPFVQVGNYRGRAYDPFYRTRGRGRGHWQEHREPYLESRPSHPISQLEQRVAAIKPYLDSKPLDLGGRGDTRFFIVKSFNEENIMRCVEDSIWTTQVENGDLFKAAFVACKNVILIFSANQSRAFQGYARMESIPGSEKAPAWQNNIHWESAGAFKVKWICVANTRFNRVGHLKNKLNENHPVLVGRDGQEIEEHAGAELLKLINEEAERLLDRHTKPVVPTL